MKYAVYIFLAWSTIAEFFIKKGMLPGVLSLVDEAIVVLLLTHLVYARLQSNEPLFSRTNLRIPLAILIVLSALSYTVNGGSPVLALQFLFSIAKPIIVFYWVVALNKDDSIERFALGLLKFLIVLQVPFFLYGIATMRGVYIGDNATGATITGDAHQVGIYSALGALLFLAYFILEKKNVYLFALVGCVVILIITSTKQILFLLPLIAIMLLHRQLKLSVLKISLLVVVVGGLGYVFYNRVETLWAGEWGSDFEEFSAYDFIAESEKVQGYYSAVAELPDELPVPLLGAGPGQYGSFTAMNARTPLASKYIMDYSDLIPEGYGGTLTYRSSGLIAIYGDIGILSLILLLFVYYRVTTNAVRLGTVTPDSFTKAIAFVTAGSGILIVAESVLQNIFEGNWFVLNFFWILSGCIVARERREKEGPTAS